MFLKVFWNTLCTSFVVTLGTLVLGYPVALALVRAPRWAPLILIIVLLPFWTSVLVRSYAWMVLMGRHGLINEALLALRPDRSAVAHTEHAARDADRDDPHPAALHDPADRQRAAADRSVAARAPSPGWARRHGRVFRQVILPLSMPGVAAGLLLVFVLALGFYITPAMVGGPREITLSMLIAQQVDQLNWAYAATLSAVLLATTLAIIAAFYRLPGVGDAFRMATR